MTAAVLGFCFGFTAALSTLIPFFRALTPIERHWLTHTRKKTHMRHLTIVPTAGDIGEEEEEQEVVPTPIRVPQPTPEPVPA